MLRPAVFPALLLICAPAAEAQQDRQLWLQSNIRIPLAVRTTATLETIGRFSDRTGGLFHTEFGVLLSQRIAGRTEIGVGYRHVGAHGGNTAADEDRFRQQIVAASGRWNGRFRIDERFSEAGGEVGVRARPLLRYTYPLARNGPALFVSHESFFNLNTTSWGPKRGYERMRNQAGLSIPFTRALTGDVAYLNQYRFARGGARSQMDHALSINLTYAL